MNRNRLTVLAAVTMLVAMLTGCSAGAPNDILRVEGTIVTCSAGGGGLLNGQYTFALKGYDGARNPILVSGVFTADGSGNLTGTVDMSLADGMHAALPITAGSYTVGSDNRGTLNITTAAEGTQHYRISLGTVGTITACAASNGFMIDYDVAGPYTSGTIRQQTTSSFSTAQITGNWAFGADAIQNTAQGGGKFGCVGFLSLSAGVVTGGAEDCNQHKASDSSTTLDFNSENAAFPASPVSIGGSGSYTIDASTGRGTLVFTPSGGSAVNAFIYVVSQTEVLLMSNGNETTTLIFGGAASHQQSAAFANSSFSGTSVLYLAGLGSLAPSNPTGESMVSLAILKTTGASQTFTMSEYTNNTGVVSTSTPSGTFSVASNGRVTTTGLAANPVMWMVATNVAYILSPDAAVEIGFATAQSSTAAPTGTYANGSVNPQAAGASDNLGVATFSSPNATFTGDYNLEGALTTDVVTPTTLAVDPTGTGLVPSGCTLTGSSSTCSDLFIVTSPTMGFIIDVTQSTVGHPLDNPDLSFAQQ
jgi:hypothetical protein